MIFSLNCCMDLLKLLHVFIAFCQTKPSWSLTNIRAFLWVFCPSNEISFDPFNQGGFGDGLGQKKFIKCLFWLIWPTVLARDIPLSLGDAQNFNDFLLFLRHPALFSPPPHDYPPLAPLIFLLLMMQWKIWGESAARPLATNIRYSHHLCLHHHHRRCCHHRRRRRRRLRYHHLCYYAEVKEKLHLWGFFVVYQFNQTPCTWQSKWYIFITLKHQII